MSVDVGGHVVAEIDQEPGERRLHFGLGLAVARRFVALEPREYRRGDIELNGGLIVRQARGDLVDLAANRGVVDRIGCGMQRVVEEQPDHRMRRRHRDHELDVSRDLSLPLHVGEGRV